MLTPFILFFALALAVAVIAYWSDNLGKKLGKKRVSWFGFRPRTTATLLTILSSEGIMLATILVLLLTFKPLGAALFLFDEVRKHNNELTTQNDKLSGLNNSLLKQQSQLNTNNDELKKNNREASQQLDSTRQKLTQANTKVQQAEDARQVAQSAERQAVSGKERAQQSEGRAQQGERTATRQAQHAQHSLTLTQTTLGQTQAKLIETNSQLRSAHANFNAVNGKLAKAQDNLKVAQSNLKITQKLTATALKDTATAYKETAAAKQNLKDLLSQANDLLSQANDSFTSATGHTVRITVDQALASRVIETNESTSQIEAGVRQMLRDAQTYVSRPEGIPGATLALSAVRVSTRTQALVLTPDQVVNGLINFIGQEKAQVGQVSVRLLANRNFSDDEKQVTVHVSVVEVQPALSPGMVLVEHSLDGRLSRAVLFRQILDLMDAGAYQAAKNNNVNPPRSPGETDFFAPDTRERIFDALDEIHKINGMAHVKVVSATSSSTVDQPHVRFEVEAEKT